MIGVNTPPIMLFPWIPKNQNKLNKILNKITAGSEDDANINGLITVKINAQRLLPLKDVQIAFSIIIPIVNTAAGINASNGAVTLGGTESGILILMFFFIKKRITSTVTKATRLRKTYQQLPGCSPVILIQVFHL